MPWAAHVSNGLCETETQCLQASAVAWKRSRTSLFAEIDDEKKEQIVYVADLAPPQNQENYRKKAECC